MVLPGTEGAVEICKGHITNVTTCRAHLQPGESRAMHLVQIFIKFKVRCPISHLPRYKALLPQYCKKCKGSSDEIQWYCTEFTYMCVCICIMNSLIFDGGGGRAKRMRSRIPFFEDVYNPCDFNSLVKC